MVASLSECQGKGNVANIWESEWVVEGDRAQPRNTMHGLDNIVNLIFCGTSSVKRYFLQKLVNSLLQKLNNV
jgi:hypothetical protein